MTRSFRILTLSVLAIAMFPALGFAQVGGIGLIPRSYARHMGLERAWFAQVEMDPKSDRVRAMVLYQPGSLQDDVADDADLFDESLRRDLPPLGLNNLVDDTSGAAAVNQNPGAIQPAEDSEANQRSTIYVLTEKSVLQSIDAETGRTNWVRIVGDPDLPAEAPAVNKNYLAMINGVDLYVLRRDTGETLWSRRLTSAPLSPLAMSANWMYVPSANGMLTAMNIVNPEERWGFASGDSIHVPPVVTRDTVAWATSYGRVFLGEKHTSRVTRRFDATRSTASPPVYWPPYIYITSMDGYVNAVHERSGVAVWRFSSGFPIYQPVVALEDANYVITEPGGLHSLSLDGAPLWYKPGIVQVLSVTANHVFALDQLDRLVALDKTTGATTGAMSLVDQQSRLTNMVNDRIYVCTERGLIQCLHEIGVEEPVIHAPPPREAEDGAAADGAPAAIDG